MWFSAPIMAFCLNFSLFCIYFSIYFPFSLSLSRFFLYLSPFFQCLSPFFLFLSRFFLFLLHFPPFSLLLFIFFSPNNIRWYFPTGGGVFPKYRPLYGGLKILSLMHRIRIQHSRIVRIQIIQGQAVLQIRSISNRSRIQPRKYEHEALIVLNIPQKVQFCFVFMLWRTVESNSFIN